LNEEYADHVYLPIVKYILLMRLSMKSVLFFHAYELKVGKGLAFFACVQSPLVHLCFASLHAIVQVVSFSNKDRLYTQYCFPL